LSVLRRASSAVKFNRKNGITKKNGALLRSRIKTENKRRGAKNKEYRYAEIHEMKAK
jgi:hypothetical protein